MAQKQLRMTAAEYRASPRKRRHKYGAKPKTVDGIRFDSTGEAMRWMELKLLERTGKIVDLKRQVPYELHAKGGTFLGRYLADFEYVTIPSLRYQTTVEDFKGVILPLAKWKIRHAEAEYGFKILLTGPAAKPKRSRT